MSELTLLPPPGFAMMGCGGVGRGLWAHTSAALFSPVGLASMNKDHLIRMVFFFFFFQFFCNLPVEGFTANRPQRGWSGWFPRSVDTLFSASGLWNAVILCTAALPVTLGPASM